MDKSTNDDNIMSVLGWLFHIVGWAICVASVVFAMENKSADPPYVIPFWACLAALVSAATTYFIARQFFDGWKSKAVRAYFSPYIIGATSWISLVALFAALRAFG